MGETSKAQDPKELAPQSADLVALAGKVVFGLVPQWGGTIVGELVGSYLPNQRMDRLIKFVEVLNQRFAALEEDFIRSQATNDNFTELLEEGFRQAARSVSDERREYIASLIDNSLKSEDIEYHESRHLLRILGEVNDIEVIWLRFYYGTFLGDDSAFQEKHKSIIEPVAAYMGSPPEVGEKAALQRSYKNHLASLGLLEQKFDFDRTASGVKLKPTGHNITPLGRLLLKEIGLADPSGRP